MFHILTLNNIAAVGLNQLPADNFNVSADAADPEGILVRSASMHEMELGDNLMAIARAGAGVNNIPIEKCNEKGIVLFNTPGANANAVRELVMAGVLLSSRKIMDGISWALTLKGEKDVPGLVENGKSKFAGPEIAGKNMGVIGLGAVGVLVANACNSMNMQVEGFDPYISVDSAWHLSRSIIKASTPDMIYETSDYISLHLPLNDDTRNMINRDVIAKMKDGVRIMNFSRGELVDNDAIKEALKSGKVSAYVTDFPNGELLGVENVICIPHLGASTPESEENCAVMAANQLKRFLEDGSIINSVNMPECDFPLTERSRICVIHQNIPNVVGPVTTALAKRSINIDNMVNKSKKTMAYTMIDVDNGHLKGGEADKLKTELLAINGVIKVRVI